MKKTMFNRNRPVSLGKQLTVVIVLKLIGLTAIWWFLIRGHKVPHEAADTATRFFSMMNGS